MEEFRNRALAELEALRAEDIDHLMCGHCGGIDDVKEVDLLEKIRYLCINCRRRILEWI